jgi:hypothetical protein
MVQHFICILVPQDLAVFRIISTESGSYSLSGLIHTKSISYKNRENQTFIVLYEILTKSSGILTKAHNYNLTWQLACSRHLVPLYMFMMHLIACQLLTSLEIQFFLKLCAISIIFCSVTYAGILHTALYCTIL